MRLLRNTKERLLGTFEEGPVPPSRIRSGVELFARTNPKATIAEWTEFAASHAELSYRQGYVRGFERGERLGPDWQDPDEMAALLEHLEDAKLTGLPAFDPELSGTRERHAPRGGSQDGGGDGRLLGAAGCPARSGALLSVFRLT